MSEATAEFLPAPETSAERQGEALTAPASAAALCADDVWTRTRNACSRHGGVKVLLKQ
jgi:hypothetical protein